MCNAMKVGRTVGLCTGALGGGLNAHLEPEVTCQQSYYLLINIKEKLLKITSVKNDVAHLRAKDQPQGETVQLSESASLQVKLYMD